MRRDTRSVAIVHDFLYCYSGAERVLEQLVALYPAADLFALFDFLPPDGRSFIRDKPVCSTFIQRLPFARAKHRLYLPLMPLAIEQLNVSGYDLVISSSYLAAKGVLTGPGQLHICYCHTPVRYAWDLQHSYLAAAHLTRGIRSVLARLIMHYIRGWDVRSANGVDVFVSNSRFVARRIEKAYRRDAVTIYPPVDTEGFSPGRRERGDDFYLTVSRMVPYKRVDLIVEAFAKTPERRLVVIGTGPEKTKIRQKAGSNVQLLGYQPFEIVRDYMRRASAFVFAAEEDFGIVPVEAHACGTPVIALGQGGVLESVFDGLNGILFAEQTCESLLGAVKRFETEGVEWSGSQIRDGAERFSCSRFRREFSDLVETEWAAFERTRGRGARLTDRRQLTDIRNQEEAVQVPARVAAF